MQTRRFSSGTLHHLYRLGYGFLGYRRRGNVLLSVNVCYTDIDTRNGGVDQNQGWLRTGNRTDDLKIARDIIAGNGTFFAPQAVIVFSWYKVEAYDQRVGAQNTSQLAMAYSATGETWLMSSYGWFQCQDGRYFEWDQLQPHGCICASHPQGRPNLSSDQGTDQTPTKAPTKSPSKAPTTAPTSSKCGLFGWSIFRPSTLCGVLGRWLEF